MASRCSDPAEANKLTPKEQADQTSQRFKDTWKLLGISNDDFIRTTEPRHFVAVQKLMQAAYDNGYIELGSMRGSIASPARRTTTPTS